MVSIVVKLACIVFFSTKLRIDCMADEHTAHDGLKAY